MNINLDIQRVVGYRMWCNKLWNAIRFAMINLGPGFKPPSLRSSPPEITPAAPNSNPTCSYAPVLSFDFSSTPLPLSCRWILSSLTSAVQKAVTALQAYDLAEATSAAYAWWQYSLCDVFIEVSKAAMSGSDEGEGGRLKQV